MTALLALITSPLGRTILKWAGVGLGVLLIVITLLAAKGRYDTARRHEGAAAVQATIDAPVTGWRARLAQAQTNAAMLQAQLDAQSKAVQAQADRGAAATRAAEAGLSAAQAESARLRGKTATILRTASGGDTCTRTLDVWRRAVEASK